jgi:YfiH family protein
VQSHQAGSIKYYQFASFEDQGLYHAVFTRHGGISPSPWKSLNFGASVGDDGKRVQQNKENALAAIGIGMDSVYDVHQVHSNDIVITEHALPPDGIHIKADAMITRMPGVTLMMRFADCVPILLFDPVNRVVGLSHAGWKGTINKIAGKTVEKMKATYGTDPDSLLVGIGPSIGPDHYSVGADVVEQVVSSFGDSSDQLLLSHQGKSYFDLWKANIINLTEVGVNKIEIAEICTQCRLDDWYSHRGEQGETGRFGVVLGLEL